MAEIERWRRKPEKDKSPQVSARYLPPEASLGAFLEIAHMADSAAQVKKTERQPNDPGGDISL